MLGTAESSVKHYGLETTPGGHRVRAVSGKQSREPRPGQRVLRSPPRFVAAKGAVAPGPLEKNPEKPKSSKKKPKSKAKKIFKNKVSKKNFYQPIGNYCDIGVPWQYNADCYNDSQCDIGLPWQYSAGYYNDSRNCALVRQRDNDYRNAALVWQRDNDYRNAALSRQWNNTGVSTISLPPPVGSVYAEPPVGSVYTEPPVSPMSALSATAALPVLLQQTDGTPESSLGYEWKLLLVGALFLVIILYLRR